jgi:hypothetical protein
MFDRESTGAADGDRPNGRTREMQGATTSEALYS